jgi:hypothetical protein
MSFSLLDATQENKKCSKFGNIVNACSNNVDESIKFIKSSHTTSTSFIDV